MKFEKKVELSSRFESLSTNFSDMAFYVNEQFELESWNLVYKQWYKLVGQIFHISYKCSVALQITIQSSKYLSIWNGNLNRSLHIFWLLDKLSIRSWVLKSRQTQRLGYTDRFYIYTNTAQDPGAHFWIPTSIYTKDSYWGLLAVETQWRAIYWQTVKKTRIFFNDNIDVKPKRYNSCSWRGLLNCEKKWISRIGSESKVYVDWKLLFTTQHE